MKSHQLFRELLQSASAKVLAAELGLSTSMIYKWAEPATQDGSGTLNPLDRIEQLIRVAPNRLIADWVCERAGGFFVKSPAVKASNDSRAVASAAHEIVQEFAETLSAIAMAAVDSSICEQETASIRARWQQLKSVTEEFVVCCERGDFDALRHRRRPPTTDAATSA